MPDQQELIDLLIEKVLVLQRLQDESALNEVALIQTLQELVPGFSPRFAQLRIGVEKMMTPANKQEHAKLVEAFRKAKM
jgi:hypothetical protein